jgi:serine/threonine protein kinase
MGEVYRARDTRLERTVAIKILPPDRNPSPEARQRFERQARTTSQLTHPHICALYDVGHQETGAGLSTARTPSRRPGRPPPAG